MESYQNPAVGNPTEGTVAALKITNFHDTPRLFIEFRGADASLTSEWSAMVATKEQFAALLTQPGFAKRFMALIVATNAHQRGSDTLTRTA